MDPRGCEKVLLKTAQMSQCVAPPFVLRRPIVLGWDDSGREVMVLDMQQRDEYSRCFHFVVENI